MDEKLVFSGKLGTIRLNSKRSFIKVFNDSIVKLINLSDDEHQLLIRMFDYIPIGSNVISFTDEVYKDLGAKLKIKKKAINKRIYNLAGNPFKPIERIMPRQYKINPLLITNASDDNFKDDIIKYYIILEHVANEAHINVEGYINDDITKDVSNDNHIPLFADTVNNKNNNKND